MVKEFNFWEDIENILDEHFPKGECEERGNALVLFAIITIKLNEAVKKLKNEFVQYTDDVIVDEIIDKIFGEELSK